MKMNLFWLASIDRDTRKYYLCICKSYTKNRARIHTFSTSRGWILQHLSVSEQQWQQQTPPPPPPPPPQQQQQQQQELEQEQEQTEKKNIRMNKIISVRNACNYTSKGIQDR